VSIALTFTIAGASIQGVSSGMEVEASPPHRGKRLPKYVQISPVFRILTQSHSFLDFLRYIYRILRCDFSRPIVPLVFRHFCHALLKEKVALYARKSEFTVNEICRNPEVRKYMMPRMSTFGENLSVEMSK
jgi:hypothetical protein